MFGVNKNSKGVSLILAIIILAILGSGGVIIYANRFKIFEYRLKQAQKRLPAVTSHESRVTSNGLPSNEKLSVTSNELPANENLSVTNSVDKDIETNNLDTSTSSVNEVLGALPPEINLAVPFTPQAPFAVWDELHEDACEEASVIMAARYYKNQPITGPEDADEEIRKITAWENENFGFNKDTSAALTARILTNYYGFKNVVVKYDADVGLDSIKKELASGRPVIVPNFGQALYNPFFRPPGPPYHMIVIKGYTRDEKFIVNDPGTKRGADFVYTQKVVMDSINDWDNENNRLSGRKAMIIVY